MDSKIRARALGGLVIASVTAFTLAGCVLPPSGIEGAPATEESSATETEESTAPARPTPPPPPTQEPEAAPEEGTLQNPFPLETEVGADPWWTTVYAPILDVGGAVREANQFNEQAPSGSIYVQVPIDVRYTGDGSANTMELSYDFVTSGGSIIESAMVTGEVNGHTDNPYVDLSEGLVSSFSAFFIVPEEDAAEGTLRITAGWVNSASGFVSLH